ncbi:MAG: ABC transporter permease [Oscillospiraceae bacterium]|nr:ABC transporter permease [Oscillospiraceae bacterium]
MAENKINLDQFNMSEAELFAPVDHDEFASERITAPRYSYWKSVFRVFFKKKINTVVLLILAILIAFSYLYPAIINYDVNVDPYINLMDSTAKHLKPAAAMEKFGTELKWVLGSGGAGESTFDAIWYGSSISISLALVCAAINMFLGVAIGAVWGFSKKIDVFMTEVYNVIANVPYVLLISVIVLVMSASFWSMVFALTVTGWVAIAYFIRTQVIIIRDREYNLASKCLGTPITRIATKNILPFMTSVIVTLVATEIPSYISYEVFLSFIGMGLKDMSLGKLIQAAQSAMVTPGWEIEFWSPVAVASIIAVVLYIVGQNLGDASDPRTHM